MLPIPLPPSVHILVRVSCVENAIKSRPHYYMNSEQAYKST